MGCQLVKNKLAKAREILNISIIDALAYQAHSYYSLRSHNINWDLTDLLRFHGIEDTLTSDTSDIGKILPHFHSQILTELALVLMVLALVLTLVPKVLGALALMIYCQSPISFSLIVFENTGTGTGTDTDTDGTGRPSTNIYDIGTDGF